MWRGLCAVSAVAAAIELTFWIGDKIEGLPFHGQWILLSSIVWTIVFFLLSRRRAGR